MADIERTSSIHYEAYLGETDKYVSGTINNKVTLPKESSNKYQYDGKATKKDCLIASASGILTGLLDIFWVGEFSLSGAQTIGREQVNKFVIKIASSQGCKKSSLEDSIRFLEKKYANPSDKLTSEFGGGLQHHLRDFSHHASPIGLVFSILTQFTGRGYGTDTDGRLISPALPDNALIGKTIEEKIFYGVLYWAFHLISDMAGSSNNAGAGTGIPGPLLSLMKEISALPVFQNKTINYKDSEITISTWISKLFNGTALHRTENNDLIRFDLRTEIGIVDFGLKQSIPIIINQCIVRSFYFLNRLYHEISDKKIKSIKELFSIDAGRVLPFNNRCVTRMITISSGIFTAMDMIDAAVRAKAKSGNSNASFIAEMLLRINFIGVVNFAIAIKNDVKSILSNRKQFDNGTDGRIFEISDNQTIEIDAEMDNTAIYRYRFDELLNSIKNRRKQTNEYYSRHPQERKLLYDMRTQEFDYYHELISDSESMAYSSLLRTIFTIFDQNNIPYEESIRVNRNRYFDFIQIENGKRIGYYFTTWRLKRGLHEIYTKHRENTNVDEVRYFFALNSESDVNKYIKMLNDISSEKCNGYLKFALLKEFFDHNIRKGEYEIFKKYLDEFNEKAKNTIAYNAVIIPTEEEIVSFKQKKAEMLQNFSYDTMLPSDLFDSQKNILKTNYITRGLYAALLSDMDFADSFITSEWNYDVNRATGVLDQTGIIAGYLKSVEQLLYAVIKLSKNKNKFIRLKNGEDGEFNSDNEEYVNSTLGSLIHFTKNNGDILDVNNYVKKYIVDTLFEWTDNERNGHLHKDNIHDPSKINEIREHTILLYYLILGGFTISDNDFKKIGINKNTEKNPSDDEVYKAFKKWATPIILYDVPIDSGAVGFFIISFNEKPWEISLQALSDSTLTDYRWNHKQLFSTSTLPNNFYLKEPLNYSEGKEMIIHLVERFMSEEGPAQNKLKSIPKIRIGDFEVIKEYINK